jgi:signal peptidase I
MKLLKEIFHFISLILLFVVLPIVLFTLVTSRAGIFGGIRSFVILSGSMAPVLPVGSVVYTQKTLGYREGDVIAFNKGDITVTHRIHAIVQKNNSTVYKTKGDANNTDDSQLVSPSSILGKEFFYLPSMGYVIVFLRTIPGFITLIVVPGLLFIGLEFGNIKREIEKEVEKKILKRMQTT